MKIGICSTDFQPASENELFSRIRSFGFTCSQFSFCSISGQEEILPKYDEELMKRLNQAAKENGMKCVAEIMDANHLPLYKDIDYLQVGSRNMQNITLLKALGEQDKPVILKRGFGSTINEWIFAAEYIVSGGNRNVTLCERGIRTFEDSTRFTLDISAIPVVKSKSNLEIIVDPCHAAGNWEYVNALAKAGLAAGADGLMIEVHNDPDHALSDGAQSLTPASFDRLAKEVL